MYVRGKKTKFIGWLDLILAGTDKTLNIVTLPFVEPSPASDTIEVAGESSIANSDMGIPRSAILSGSDEEVGKSDLAEVSLFSPTSSIVSLTGDGEMGESEGTSEDVSSDPISISPPPDLEVSPPLGVEDAREVVHLNAEVVFARSNNVEPEVEITSAFETSPLSSRASFDSCTSTISSSSSSNASADHHERQRFEFVDVSLEDDEHDNVELSIPSRGCGRLWRTIERVRLWVGKRLRQCNCLSRQD